MTGQSAETRRETVLHPARHAIGVTAAVWSVLQPLSRDERDRVLGHALAVSAKESLRVLVRDHRDRPLAPCNQARARRLVNRGRAQWIALAPPIIRLTRRATRPVGTDDEETDMPRTLPGDTP